MRGPDRAGILQRGYSNCSKDCSTFALDTLGGRAPPAYIAAHATHNPYLAAVIGGKGYHDAFLLTLDGDCIWSYAKEPEYTSNFLSGPYSQAGLGEAFRASLAEPSQAHQTPFIPWAPTNGALASFICTGLYAQNGTLMGVIGIQRSSDALDFASDSRFREAMAGFTRGWQEIGGAGARKAYVDTNPNPVGSKESLDYAPGPAEYHSVHKKYHAYFRELVQDKGYADLMFVDPQGNCVYSVCKGLDFGTNVLTGPYNSTGVAKAFLRAVQDPDGLIETAFEPYAPSNNALASFTAAGVRASGGSAIGFVVLQVSSPLLVSLDENGDAIDSYAILNVVSSGKLLKMVQVAVVLYERPDFEYSICARSTAMRALPCVDGPCDNTKLVHAGTGNCRRQSFGPVAKKERLRRMTF